MSRVLRAPAARPSTTVAAPDRRSGTQSVERAILILREIAARGGRGWGLRDLARQCELDPGTTHRILKCLVDQRLVRQAGSDRRYLLGPLNFELGLSVPHRAPLLESVHPVLRRLARTYPKTSAVCFVRGEDDCLCVARSGTAAYTGHATRTRVGQRVPMLSLAAGIAMLATMPAKEAAPVIARNRERISGFGETHWSRVDDMLRAARRHGYALSEGLLWHGVNTVSVPFGAPGAPIGALSISAWEAHHRAEFLLAAVTELEEAAALVTEGLLA